MLGSGESCLTDGAFVVASHGDAKSSADDVEDGDEGVLEDELLVSERECERRLSFFTQPCTYRVRIAMTSLLQCFFSHLLLCILSQKNTFLGNLSFNFIYYVHHSHGNYILRCACKVEFGLLYLYHMH